MLPWLKGWPNSRGKSKVEEDSLFMILAQVDKRVLHNRTAVLEAVRKKRECQRARALICGGAHEQS